MFSFNLKFSRSPSLDSRSQLSISQLFISPRHQALSANNHILEAATAAPEFASASAGVRLHQRRNSPAPTPEFVGARVAKPSSNGPLKPSVAKQMPESVAPSCPPP
ncbi:hypothetical protein TIFTF001_004238 [Ficus carica]|uniref:Uncharacterized protein n=1 Tax=Ficus carica TaxID=3494 RepID=A0AA87ZX41_FICCA|nr:hypothetical protein TIFTF001_004238 [Ficus carica]